MSFGYSAGDVIAGANLTYQLIRIMANTKGASEEYLETMAEVSAMQQAFLKIGEIRSHEMLPAATVNAASHIVLSSMEIIRKFLERTKNYQRQLENPQASTFQSSWYKVGWSLYKSHELRDLRDALHTRLTSVQVLLSAASYCEPVPANMTPYHINETSQQDDGHRPYSEKKELRQFIHFKDAVGRKFNFPFRLCQKWVGMEELIKQACLGVEIFGPHVQQGHYDLMDSDGTIILPTCWEKVIEPGMSIAMTMWPLEPKTPENNAQRTQGVEPPPAWEEMRTNAPGNYYRPDHNTQCGHENPPWLPMPPSHPPPMPSINPPPILSMHPTLKVRTSQLPTASMGSTLGENFESYDSSKGMLDSHYIPNHVARDSQNPRPSGRVQPDEEFAGPIQEINLSYTENLTKLESDPAPLTWPLENRVEILEELLDKGEIDINLSLEDGRTLLSLAAEHGDKAVAKILLEQGDIDVDLTDNDGRSPLSWAAEFGNKVLAKMLIETGEVDVDSRDDDGRSPLSWAAEYGQQRVVQVLLDTGKVDVDSRDKTGRSPLLWASAGGHVEVVKQLLDTGIVNTAQEDIYGLSACQLADLNHHTGTFELLVARGAPIRPDFYGLESLFD